MLIINYINSDKEDGKVVRLDLNSNVIAEKNNIKRFISYFKDGKVYKDGKLISEINEKKTPNYS